MPNIESTRIATRHGAIRRVTIIGGGVIGASWAALLLANGLLVTINDPDPEIARKVTAVIQAALPPCPTWASQQAGSWLV